MKILPLDAKKFLESRLGYENISKEMPMYPGYCKDTLNLESSRYDVCLIKSKKKYNAISTTDELFLVWRSPDKMDFQKVESSELVQCNGIDICIDSFIEKGETLQLSISYQFNKGIVGENYRRNLRIDISMINIGILKEYNDI